MEHIHSIHACMFQGKYFCSQPDIFFIVVITTFKKECLNVLKFYILQCFSSSTARPTLFPWNKQSFELIQDNRPLANMNENNQNEHNQMTVYKKSNQTCRKYLPLAYENESTIPFPENRQSIIPFLLGIILAWGTFYQTFDMPSFVLEW